MPRIIRKKYGVGTPVTNYMQDPGQVLTQNNINQIRAQAEAQDTLLSKGLGMTAGLLSQNANMIGGGIDAMRSNSSQMAMGGEVDPQLSEEEMMMQMQQPQEEMPQQGNVPVEIEGEEVGETPNGDLFEAQGPSHEQGGVDVSLPEGTEMYSKRIKVDGVSMANRKKKRKKRSITLEELLEKSKTDKLLKNTVERETQNMEKEEQFDSQMQKGIAHLMQQQGLDSSGESQTPQMALGGPIFPGLDYFRLKETVDNMGNQKLPFNYDRVNPRTMMPNNDRGLGMDYLSPSINNINVSRSVNPGKRLTPIVPRLKDYKTKNKNLKTLVTNQNVQLNPFGDMPILDKVAISNDKKVNNKTKDNFSLMKGLGKGGKYLQENMGDIIGNIGAFVNTFEPAKNTMRNRATDTANVNMFKEYGQDALMSNNASKQYVNQMKANQMQDLALSQNSAARRNRGSARGINTLRGLDMATEQQANKQSRAIENSYGEQMMRLLQQQASLQSDRDLKVMGGEQARDLADRQDKDNFYSQMADNIVNKGFGLQNMGKQVNQHQLNKMNLASIEKFKQLGLDQNIWTMGLTQIRALEAVGRVPAGSTQKVAQIRSEQRSN